VKLDNLSSYSYAIVVCPYLNTSSPHTPTLLFKIHLNIINFPVSSYIFQAVSSLQFPYQNFVCINYFRIKRRTQVQDV
jgi:hypothetical protein